MAFFFFSVLLVLLSSDLWKSAANKNGGLESTSTEPSSAPRSINDSTSYEQFRNDSESVESLLVPEDPERYKQIVELVRKLFERVGQSIGSKKILNGDSKGGVDNKIDRFSRVAETRNSRPSDGKGKDEEKYLLQRNPEGGGVSTGKERRNNYQKIEPDEHDLLEAVNFGLDAMNELYTVKEPMLYSMGEFCFFFRYCLLIEG